MSAARGLSPLVFFHPTRWAVIADEQALLGLGDAVDIANQSHDFFADPQCLVDTVSRRNADYGQLIDKLVSPFDELADDADGVFSYAPIESLIERQSRGDAYSVLILDYSVLGESGVREIDGMETADHERVLLIEEGSLRDALELLREGCIDRFYVMGAAGHLHGSLPTALELCASFHRRSQSLLQPLNKRVQPTKIRTAIDSYMLKLLANGVVDEFYRDRASMSYLCVNGARDFLRFAFLDSAAFRECALLALGLGAPKDVVFEMRSERGYIFGDDLSYRIPKTSEDWRRVMCRAESFESSDTWKVVFTEDPVLEAASTY